MKNIILLLSMALFSFFMNAQAVYDATCFESDFTENLPAGVTVEVESGIDLIEDGYLKGTYTGIGQWKCMLKMTFATPLDLSENAEFTVKVLSNDINPTVTLRARLRSDGGGESSDFWNARFDVSNNGTLVTKSINFVESDYTNTLDLTAVNYMELMTTEAGPFSGTLQFDYIKLGQQILPAKKFYYDDFSGSDFSDSNVSFGVDGGKTYSIEDGSLKFQIKDNPGWGQVFEFAFDNPLDISEYPILYLDYTKDGDGAFQARMVDAAGNATGDENDYVFWGTDTKDFTSYAGTVNLAKIKYIRFYDKNLGGGNNISISEIRVGKDTELGIKELGKEYAIYPTVVDNYITLSGVEGNCTTSVFNLSGINVLNSINENMIDISGLPAGVYLVKINDINVTKIIKR